MLNIIMPKSNNIVKRKPGRPPELGAGPAFIGLRLPVDLLKSVDEWARRHRIAGRSEALRRLVEKAIGSAPRRK
jgi:predicted component of type VI protein secretion system